MKDEPLKEYLEERAGVLSPSTRQRMACQVGQFLKAMDEKGMTLGEVEEGAIVSYAAEVRRRMTPLSAHDHLSTLRIFLTWLYRRGAFLWNPFPKGLLGKRMGGLPRHVPSPEETLCLIREVESKSGFPIRNRAILELAYGSALRRGELGRLCLSDLKGDWLRVRGKGNKERWVPLGCEASKWLWHYVKTERMENLSRHNPLEEALFVGRGGRRLGLPSFTALVRWKKPAASKATLHSLRHACATHMLQNGAGLPVLQKLLGHQKLSTTQIYTKVDTSDLRRMLQNHHPRG